MQHQRAFGRGGQGLRMGAPLRLVGDDQPVDLPRGDQLLRVGEEARIVRRDEDAGAAVAKLVGELALGIQRAQVDDMRAGAERTEEGEGVIGRVRQVEGDAGALADAE